MYIKWEKVGNEGIRIFSKKVRNKKMLIPVLKQSLVRDKSANTLC